MNKKGQDPYTSNPLHFHELHQLKSDTIEQFFVTYRYSSHHQHRRSRIE